MMSKAGFLGVVLMVLFAGSVAAGCWECKYDECATASRGHSGKSQCSSGKLCTGTCKPTGCELSGGECTGVEDCGEVQECPFQQNALTPNGEPLPNWQPPLPRELPTSKERTKRN